MSQTFNKVYRLAGGTPRDPYYVDFTAENGPKYAVYPDHVLRIPSLPAQGLIENELVDDEEIQALDNILAGIEAFGANLVTNADEIKLLRGVMSDKKLRFEQNED